jgi:hypothetical protein
METQKRELDVDFIGGEKPLTDSEEKALSEYFTEKTANKNSKTAFSKTQPSSRKVVA